MQRVHEESKEESKNNFRQKKKKKKKKKDRTFQKLWDTAKTFLRGKFIEIWGQFKKQEKSQSNLALYVKELEKEETKLNIRRK